MRGVAPAKYVSFMAAIDRKVFKVRREYHITMPQGIDIVVILVIIIALDGKEHTNDAAANAGGSVGGGGFY